MYGKDVVHFLARIKLLTESLAGRELVQMFGQMIVHPKTVLMERAISSDT
jgi:hypothetical protein